MIKGWRLDPAWGSYYQQVQANRIAAKSAKLLEEMAERQRLAIESAAKHQLECHAAKVASGEITDSRLN